MRRQKKDHGFQRGFTLLELMISVAIMAGAILSLVGLYFTFLVLIETNKNSTVAIYHAQAALEAIRNVDPFDSVGAAFPAGNVIASFNFTRLNNESIMVAYGAGDPLTVTVTVNWQERTRGMSESLTTLMTQR